MDVISLKIKCGSEPAKTTCWINIEYIAIAVLIRKVSHQCSWALTRYAKSCVAHAPGMPGTFSPPSRVSDPDMHHDTCVTHVPWCMPGSLTSGFLWSRWLGNHSRHSRRMHNPQVRVSDKRSMLRVLFLSMAEQCFSQCEETLRKYYVYFQCVVQLNPVIIVGSAVTWHTIKTMW